MCLFIFWMNRHSNGTIQKGEKNRITPQATGLKNLWSTACLKGKERLLIESRRGLWIQPIIRFGTNMDSGWKKVTSISTNTIMA